MCFYPEASFGLRVLLLPASVRVCQPWACPHHNSSLIQAKITKCGPQVQNTFVTIPIVLGSDRLWPFKVKSNLKVTTKEIHNQTTRINT